MVLAMWASFDEIFNVCVNTRPIECEVSSCLRSYDTLVGLMESTEHRCSEAVGDVEAAAAHYEVILNAEVVLDTPEFLQRIFQAGFLIWKANQDGVFKCLVFLIFSGVSPDLV